jgi:hypothetical protein
MHRSTLAAVLLLGSLNAAFAQAPTLPTVMNEKAENAQRILRPLVIGDFATVDRYAERLARLTYTEIASWQARPDSDYIRQANAFVKGVQDLREAARRRDLEQASTAYTALIDSCVQCHRQVRGARAVSLTIPGPGVVVPPNGGAR